jgi:hypothetical protein
MNPKTKVAFVRFAAALYAFAGAVAVNEWYVGRSRGSIWKAVLWISLCICFLALSKNIKRRSGGVEQNDAAGKAVQ